MRQLQVLAFVAALAGAALASSHAGALPLNSANGVRAPSEAVNPVEKAACWRMGWHGWGWYPHCGPRAEVVIHEPGCRDITVRERRGLETVVRHIHRCD